MQVVYVCLFAFLALAKADFLPDHLPKFCPRSHENYNECTTKVLRKLGPYLLKGIQEINFPVMDPLDIPLFIVNRTIGKDLSFTAVFKNLKIWGFDSTQLKDFTFDTNTLSGRLHLVVSANHHEVNTKLSGVVAGIRFASEGFGFGNFSNISFIYKFVLRPTKSLGVTYYTFDEFQVKSDIGSSQLWLLSKSPRLQALNDIYSQIFNANPKPYIEAIKPIWEEATGVFFKALMERTLSTIPADELFP